MEITKIEQGRRHTGRAVAWRQKNEMQRPKGHCGLLDRCWQLKKYIMQNAVAHGQKNERHIKRKETHKLTELILVRLRQPCKVANNR